MDKSLVISSIKFRDMNKEIEVYQNTLLSSGLFVPKEPFRDEYAIYCKIEQHMDLSVDLHYLHKQTQSILTCLSKSKPSLPKTNIVPTLLSYITNSLNYAALINELDDILFNDCGCFDTFWVQDREYKLESLYYKQESWSDDISSHNVQPFKFNDDPSIALDEGVFLIMICDKWMKCLETASRISEGAKLTPTVTRFAKKVEQCSQNIIEQMQMSCVDEEHLQCITSLKTTIKRLEKN
jgi:hypothetical protein